MGTAAAVRPRSDYGSDSAIDSLSRRSSTTSAGSRPPKAAAARRQRPRRPDSGIGDSEDDALRHPAAFPRGPSDAEGHASGGYQSPLGELPRAPDVAGGDSSWIDRAGRPVSGPWTNWDRGGGVAEEELGDAKARHLEREREYLTREIYQLSAQLGASGATSTSSRLGPSDLDEDLSPTSFDTSAAVRTPAPPPGRSRRRDQAAAAAAAAAAEEAAAVAVAAAEEVATTNAAMSSRRDKRLRGGQRGDGGDDIGRNAGNGRARHRNDRENGVRSPPRRSPSATTMSPPDASADDSDSDFTTSGSSDGSRSDTSPSWRSLARQQQRSLLAAEMFSRLPQRQQQRRERYEEAASTKARRMSGRATEAAALWGRGAEGSHSDTASEKVLSEGSASESSESTSSRDSESIWF